jgi:NitT/TauT family transport system permease protein
VIIGDRTTLEAATDPEGASRGRGPHLWDTVALPALGGAALIGLWWLAAVAWNTDLVPTPPQVFDAFTAFRARLLSQAGYTLAVTLAGFAIAAAAGVALGVLLSSWRVLERAMMPWVVAVNAIPKVAAAPLLVVWLGFGMRPKVFLVILIAFFPVVLSTMAGLTSTPADLAELARSLTVSSWRMFIKIRLPWALPHIFVGFKVAISLALVGAVVAEIQTPDRGLGAVILTSATSAEFGLMFAAVGVLGVLGVCLFYLLAWAEQRLLPWAAETTG